MARGGGVQLSAAHSTGMVCTSPLWGGAMSGMEKHEGTKPSVPNSQERQAAVDQKADVVERLRAYRGRLPANFTFDREEANRR